jgi:hypothetical protein
MSSRLDKGRSLRVLEPVIITCIGAASAAAQTAKQVRGAVAVVPLQNEPSAKIVIDPPLAEMIVVGLALWAA